VIGRAVQLQRGAVPKALWLVQLGGAGGAVGLTAVVGITVSAQHSAASVVVGAAAGEAHLMPSATHSNHFFCFVHCLLTDTAFIRATKASSCW
jgi:hypothetical protein